MAISNEPRSRRDRRPARSRGETAARHLHRAGHASLLVLLSSGAAHAQGSLNVSLVGRLDPYDQYTDIWGYRSPTGGEYALIAVDVGVSVIDCTDPTTPVERALIPGPVAPLRDIKTLGSYAYVVNEGAGGLQIIDLQNPAAPELVRTWAAGAFDHSHNLAIDTDTGRIYVAGTDVGMVVFDASVHPTEPPLVGVYGGPFITEYVHDLHVQNGIAHAAMVWTGNYRLLDVSTWPIATVAEPFSAGRTTHNCWVDGADAMSVTTDEQEGGLVQFWDVRNPLAPRVHSAFSPNTASIPHNAFLVDGLCHVSWYTEGYRLLDLRDPAQPEEVGYYDTYAGPSGTQVGAFGCYPFQPSGNVYVSDRTDGLFVLRPHDLRIRHAPLPDTLREDAYRIEARLSSSAPITGAFVHWSTEGQTFSRSPLRPAPGPEDFIAAGNPGRYVGSIPGIAAPGTIWYYLTATDGQGGNARTPGIRDLYRFDVGQRLRVHFEDFEGGQSWIHGGTSDDWERGAPVGLGGTARGVSWTDPFAAYSGSNVWGNDLGLAGSNGAYATGTSNWLQSPPIPTLGVKGLRLRFRRWLSIEDASSDRARVRVNGQVVWQNGASHQLDYRWSEVDLDVSLLLDGAESAVLRFELTSDGDMELGGWQIDDVELYALVGSASRDFPTR